MATVASGPTSALAWRAAVPSLPYSVIMGSVAPRADQLRSEVASLEDEFVFMGVPDDGPVACGGVRITPLVGLVAGSLALLLAACGSSPHSGVASLGKAETTTTAQLAPAGTGGGDARGSAAQAGGAAGSGGGAGGGGAQSVGSGPQSVMVMVGGSGNYADMLKYSNCMRSHGIGNFPDPSSDGTISFNSADARSVQFQTADQTCRKLLPNGGGPPTAAEQAQGLAQLLKLSMCMRAHGIRDFPDPTSKGIRIPAHAGGDLAPNNQRFLSAEKACQSLQLGQSSGS